MRFSNFIYIVTSNLAEKKWRTFFAVFVIAFAVAVALAVTSVSTGLLTGIREKAADIFPPTIVTVKPKTVALSMLAFNSTVINSETVEKIKKIPGVNHITPQLSLKIPLRMEVEIAGQYAVTDAVVIGIEPETLKDSLPDLSVFQYDDTTSQPIPCVVPRMLLDMYNLAYADSIGFPKINEQFLLGKKFTMDLGQTYLVGGGSGKQTKLLCKVVGLSSDAALVPGVYMPMEYARRLNAWYTGTNEQPYTALRVSISRPDQVDVISKQLSDMGLMVEGKRWAYESITFATKAGAILLYVFAGLILLVTSFSILNLFSLMLSSRMSEMQLLTAVGATRSTLRWLYFSEALVIACAGLAAGGVTVWLILKWVEHAVRSRLVQMKIENLAVVPERFFAFDFLPTAAVILIVLAMSVAAPLVLTWKSTARGAVSS